MSCWDLTVWQGTRIVAPTMAPGRHTLDLLHKSHNAPVSYHKMHHFVTENCTHVHISVTKWHIVGYLPDALWDLWDASVENKKKQTMVGKDVDTRWNQRSRERKCQRALTQWGRDKMAPILQTTFSNAFPWKQTVDFFLKSVHKSLINNNPSTVPIMAWCQTGDRPLHEPMMV